jgi:hypothetical protein
MNNNQTSRNRTDRQEYWKQKLEAFSRSGMCVAWFEMSLIATGGFKKVLAKVRLFLRVTTQRKLMASQSYQDQSILSA